MENNLPQRAVPVGLTFNEHVAELTLYASNAIYHFDIEDGKLTSRLSSVSLKELTAVYKANVVETISAKRDTYDLLNNAFLSTVTQNFLIFNDIETQRSGINFVTTTIRTLSNVTASAWAFNVTNTSSFITKRDIAAAGKNPVEAYTTYLENNLNLVIARLIQLIPIEDIVSRGVKIDAAAD